MMCVMDESENTIEDGFGGVWVKHGPQCDMEVVRPGQVQCSCEASTPEA